MSRLFVIPVDLKNGPRVRIAFAELDYIGYVYTSCSGYCDTISQKGEAGKVRVCEPSSVLKIMMTKRAKTPWKQ